MLPVFITLTLDGASKSIVVNVNHIIGFYEGGNNCPTQLITTNCHEDDGYLVKESPDKIQRMINGAISAAVRSQAQVAVTQQ